jgi:hypothetical protein
MRVSQAFLIAAAASLAAPLAAQEANDAAVAENAAVDPAAPDANAVDANAMDANLVAAPVEDTMVAEETVETEAPAPAGDGGGFPWGVLGLLGLLGLIPRLRR